MADLTTEQKKTLAKLEARIEKAMTSEWDAQIETGRILSEIKANGLYAPHETITDYAFVRFDLAKPQTYRLIQAARIVDALAEAPIQPMNLGQTEALKFLGDEELPSEWERIVKKAQDDDQKITARFIKDRLTKTDATVSEADATEPEPVRWRFVVTTKHPNDQLEKWFGPATETDGNKTYNVILPDGPDVLVKFTGWFRVNAGKYGLVSFGMKVQ